MKKMMFAMLLAISTLFASCVKDVIGDPTAYLVNQSGQDIDLIGSDNRTIHLSKNAKKTYGILILSEAEDEILGFSKSIALPDHKICAIRVNDKLYTIAEADQGMLLDIKAYRHAPAMEPDINSDDYGSWSGSYVITEDNKRVWSNEYNLVFTNDFVNKLIEAAEEVH